MLCSFHQTRCRLEKMPGGNTFTHLPGLACVRLVLLRARLGLVRCILRENTSLSLCQFGRELLFIAEASAPCSFDQLFAQGSLAKFCVVRQGSVYGETLVSNRINMMAVARGSWMNSRRIPRRGTVRFRMKTTESRWILCCPSLLLWMFLGVSTGYFLPCDSVVLHRSTTYSHDSWVLQ